MEKLGLWTATAYIWLYSLFVSNSHANRRARLLYLSIYTHLRLIENYVL